MRGLSAAALLLAGALLTGPLPSAAQAPGSVTVRTNGDVTILADRIEEVAPDNLLVASGNVEVSRGPARDLHVAAGDEDRKSTRLNSSHSQISYAGFCLKKKNRS